MELTYTRVGDYELPNIILSDSDEPLGRYGTLHKEYLKAHKPALYAQLLLSERLYPICRDVDLDAKLRRKAGCSEEVILAELVYD